MLNQYAQLVAPTVPDAQAISDCASRGQLGFRTYAISANDFKDGTLGRLPIEVAREYRLSRFSRLVWVVEAIDRAARGRGDAACVLGEAVFDSTSSEYAPAALALHVPGTALVVSTKGTVRPDIRCSPNPYASGGVGSP